METVDAYSAWRNLIQKLPIAALIYERESSKILMFNRAFISLLGYSQTAFSNLAEFMSTVCPNEEHRKRVMEAWIEAAAESEMTGKDVEPLEVLLLTRNRQECYVRLQAIQEPNFIVVLLTDMNAYNEMESEIKRLATTDYLTGLPNRKYFMDILIKQLDHSRRYKENLSMLMMNLDDFKSINEQYGWEAGDQVILTVTQVLQDCIRACDLLARFDGETFCALLPATSDEGAQSLAERMRQTLRELDIHLEEDAVRLTMSIGLAHAYKGIVAPEQLLSRCQKALAEAKSMGKDCIAAYQSQIIM